MIRLQVGSTAHIGDSMSEPIDAQTAADQILLLERSALDRWGQGDPGGFLELYAAGITYFDPSTALAVAASIAVLDGFKWA